MTAIRDARTHIAAALAGLGVTVHKYPPGAVTPPAVVLLPADPYWAPTQLRGAQVGLTARLIVSTAAGPAAHAALDDLLDAATAALTAAGSVVDPVAAPTPQPDAATIAADIITFTPWES